MKDEIKLLLVDDHPVVRKGIRACLARHTHFKILDEATDGMEAVAKARKLLPDIVLMDVNMPKMGGLEATKILKRDLPQIKVVILSVQDDKRLVLQIIRSGASGYILKNAAPDELIQAIEAVFQGQAFFSAGVAQVLLNQYVTDACNPGSNALSNLTQREMEVLTLIAEGDSNKEIASKLDVSVRTVEAHRERVMRKLGVHSAVGLTKYAITHGVIVLD